MPEAGLHSIRIPVELPDDAHKRSALLNLIENIDIIETPAGPWLLLPAHPVLIDKLACLLTEDEWPEDDDPAEDDDPDEMNGDEMEESEPGDDTAYCSLRWKQQQALNFGRHVDRAPEDDRPGMLPIEFAIPLRPVI
ncbi:hypothetical protein [Oceanibaculum sp.]|uniref:hypothetical protein n=1 Tax=Oceanibaculum sp. TaxID=1903597 RepID=UPI00258FCB75|nr:hypothetical protein [Oceanibaculum sp.]MCH2394323.1 hypothetical protein [Oceanibaculum sp.]